MYKLRRVISMLILCVMMFSFAPSGIYADEEEKQRKLNEEISELRSTFFTSRQEWLMNYYSHVLDTDGNEIKENDEYVIEADASFFIIGDIRQNVGVSKFYKENGKMKYRDDDGKIYSVTMEIWCENGIGEKNNLYSGSSVVQIDDNPTVDGLWLSLPESRESDSKNPLHAFLLQKLHIDIILTSDDGSTYIIKDSDGVEINWENIGERNVTNNKTILERVFGGIFSVLSAPIRLLEEIFTSLLLAVGDGLITLISDSVGQKVTFEDVIFGDINKVSIDFWGNDDGKVEETTNNSEAISASTGNMINRDEGYMGSVLRDSVTNWYNVFSSIAIVIYLMMLLVIGIQISNSSTGRMVAKYQILLRDWVVGVGVLLLFPIIMDETVRLNTDLVATMRQALNNNNSTSIVEKSFTNKGSLFDTIFGTSDFAIQYLGLSEGKVPQKSDGIMYVRYIAGKQNRIPLAIVYLIMVFQLGVIVFVYYKRAFMLAFLVTVFPIVAISFTLDKMR